MVKCKKCGIDKPDSEYYRSKVGLRGSCKSCLSIAAKSRSDKKAKRVGCNKANLPMPSMEELRELFDYHSDGYFVRKKSRGTQKAGSRCEGKVEESGYRRMPINYNLYLTHRLIWKWHFGTEPKFIDHANKNRLDNRIENLREASKPENARNQILPCNNTSGYFGVRFYDCKKKRRQPCWVAQITVNSKKINIGYFASKLSAVLAYNKACQSLHGEYGADKIQHNIDTLRREGLIK